MCYYLEAFKAPSSFGDWIWWPSFTHILLPSAAAGARPRPRPLRNRRGNGSLAS